ncbi:MAG: glycoside hydrolase family 99-like domain-containing protein [Bacteroidaceae bacterium]|nr:glycoside hydrolase family 99-like domain-containing protein [Bacteroidaceae bacterium]
MKARVIAYYLPQFHPIPENDKFWGKGFTEWTNVAKARPLFRGHYQPRIPADLGFYDLRLPEVREQQAELAREAGVEGFCYWHYWFGGGRMLLERPFEEVLASGKPDFPFCLCWANHSWTTKTWDKDSSKMQDAMIAEQRYPGEEDDIAHFRYCLPAFKDARYITVEGKPVFGIYEPFHHPHVRRFMELWRRLAVENGLKGIYFYAITRSSNFNRFMPDGTVGRVMPDLKSSAEDYRAMLAQGYDALNSTGQVRAEMAYYNKYVNLALIALRKYLPFIPATRFRYSRLIRNFFAPEDRWENVFPTVFPQWDRSPRVGKAEGVYVDATPAHFEQHLRDALSMVEQKDLEHRIIFLRSWNEWAEGNYVEPDLKYGHGFLDAIHRVIAE